MELLAALSIGLIGSFHCIGMCGPIVFALPLGNKGKGQKLLRTSIYNLGRITTYSILGAIFGAFGKGLFLASTQQYISITVGTLIIIGVILPWSLKGRLNPTSKISSIITKIKSGMSNFLQKKSLSSLYIIGLLNGLLPCGLVYIAIAGAIATGSIQNGTLFMLMFGIGTLPVMFSVSLLSSIITIGFRNKIKRVMPVFVIIIGLTIILRGMNLGIPYLSPEFSNEEPQKVSCH